MFRRTQFVSAGILLLAMLAGACSSANDPASGAEAPDAVAPDDPGERPTLAPVEVRSFPDSPPTPTGDLADETEEALAQLFGDSLSDGLFLGDDFAAIRTLGSSEDPRVGWLIADLLQFIRDEDVVASLTTASGDLLGLDVSRFNVWGETIDHLIAWDTPAPPGYLDHKRSLYTLVLPAWGPLLVEGDIDWRHVAWGGVAIDDRPFDTTDEPCNCIPAADNPEVSSAEDAGWLADDSIVFGVTINGESRAYPRRVMEVREMVNDTLGGRDIAMPYCTLCGSAQVYFTDRLPDGVERPVLRTSGLLIRSNKVMYDITTQSVFDTFLGNAVTGPLAERDLVLEQATVVTSTWSDWKAAHPETTVLIEDLALGRDPDFRNGRDADGPIFPVGDVDDRLAVQADVVGVTTRAGLPVAFPVDVAVDALRRGESVAFDDITLELDGGGLRAIDATGADVVAHQAFWFAWSQFHPDTEVWLP
ncbi:MAG: DUF3179 domain-containing (seleno)protein [Acidimicrobiales bacterium]